MGANHVQLRNAKDIMDATIIVYRKISKSIDATMPCNFNECLKILRTINNFKKLNKNKINSVDNIMLNEIGNKIIETRLLILWNPEIHSIDDLLECYRIGTGFQN